MSTTRTFGFLEDVLGEVMALFPSRYIHVGGDEAVKDQWKASPEIQARMKALGIKDEHALQSWFIARIGKFLAAHGRRLIGWDEILEGGIPPDATVMSWRGIEGAVAAAKAGHDSVLSPAPTLYFDNRQGFGADRAARPRQSGRPADRLRASIPRRSELTAEQQRHILGLQAQSLDRACPHRGRGPHGTRFPRASAVAEIGWSHPASRDFADFIDRLVPQSSGCARSASSPASSAFAVRLADAIRAARPIEARSPCRASPGSTSATRSMEARRPLRRRATLRRSRCSFPTRLRAARLLRRSAAARRARPARRCALRPPPQPTRNSRPARTRCASRSRTIIRRKARAPCS